MKIIGIANEDSYNGRYIVEVSRDEMNKLSGETWNEQIKGRSYNVGDEIPVSSWWNFITEILDKEAKVRDLGKQLKAIGELVTDAWPSITNTISTAKKDK